MTTVQQIYEEMQRIAPLALAESWDNPGLLVDCGGEVSRVLVTLDITPEVVEEAARKGCGLIVSHHPVIFSPLKKLSGQDVAFQLAKSGISAICMHTNLDAAEGRKSSPPAAISRSTALRCRSSSPTPAKQCGGWPSSAAQAEASSRTPLHGVRIAC